MEIINPIESPQMTTARMKYDINPKSTIFNLYLAIDISGD